MNRAGPLPTAAKQNGAVAVLYVCASRNQLLAGLSARRAQDEGRAFAQTHGLSITDVLTDEYGEPDPCRRAGWCRVRALAAAGAINLVLVRWPAALAPDYASEFRHRETAWLREQGVRIRYTWAPLVSTGGDLG